MYHLGINKLTQNFAHLITKVCSEYIVTYEGDGNPLQNSCLGNPMAREAWQTSHWGHKERDETERPTPCYCAMCMKAWNAFI